MVCFYVTSIFFLNADMHIPIATIGLSGFLKSMMNLCFENFPNLRYVFPPIS
jgi:hypothetical protein